MRAVIEHVRAAGGSTDLGPLSAIFPGVKKAQLLLGPFEVYEEQHLGKRVDRIKIRGDSGASARASTKKLELDAGQVEAMENFINDNGGVVWFDDVAQHFEQEIPDLCLAVVKQHFDMWKENSETAYKGTPGLAFVVGLRGTAPPPEELAAGKMEEILAFIAAQGGSMELGPLCSRFHGIKKAQLLLGPLEVYQGPNAAGTSVDYIRRVGGDFAKHRPPPVAPRQTPADRGVVEVTELDDSNVQEVAALIRTSGGKVTYNDIREYFAALGLQVPPRLLKQHFDVWKEKDGVVDRAGEFIVGALGSAPVPPPLEPAGMQAVLDHLTRHGGRMELGSLTGHFHGVKKAQLLAGPVKIYQAEHPSHGKSVDYIELMHSYTGGTGGKGKGGVAQAPAAGPKRFAGPSHRIAPYPERPPRTSYPERSAELSAVQLAEVESLLAVDGRVWFDDVLAHFQENGLEPVGVSALKQHFAMWKETQGDSGINKRFVVAPPGTAPAVDPLEPEKMQMMLSVVQEEGGKMELGKLCSRFSGVKKAQLLLGPLEIYQAPNSVGTLVDYIELRARFGPLPEARAPAQRGQAPAQRGQAPVAVGQLELTPEQVGGVATLIARNNGPMPYADVKAYAERSGWGSFPPPRMLKSAFDVFPSMESGRMVEMVTFLGTAASLAGAGAGAPAVQELVPLDDAKLQAIVGVVEQHGGSMELGALCSRFSGVKKAQLLLGPLEVYQVEKQMGKRVDMIRLKYD